MKGYEKKFNLTPFKKFYLDSKIQPPISYQT